MDTRLRALLATLAAAVLAALGALVVLVQPASAASLVQVTNFGTNPTNLGMYEYVPNNVQAHPPILVAVHYCTGSGPAFYSGTEFASLADRYGFIIIYPSATRSGACFDVSSPGALTHNGNSDPVGIVSMVQYVEAHNNADPSRVYVTGASSGGMMTNVLLGDYPDVFKAGAAFMGVPFACFATTDGSSWNSACANGQISKTPQQWGDLARAADSGYSGARPRMELWHGTADPTLNYNNFGEEIKQWTNVLGVSQTPTSTSTPQSGWTHTTYANSAGVVQVDAYSIAGAGHVLPQTGMAAVAIHFFGLDSNGSTSPSSSPSTPPSSPSTPSSSPSTPPSSPPPAGGCKVTDAVSAWNTGLTEQITVANNGTSAVNGWKLNFTLASGQTVTSAWNATITPSSGAVSAANVSYNATIPVGGSTSFGFQANHTGNTAAPASFTLNGVACSIG
jgi:poly(hydroxyalkanoate) depolymerase family esterase